MKRYISCCLILLALVSSLVVQVSAVEPGTGSFNDTYKVKLKMVDVTDLIRCQTAEEVEALLYPTGMTAPMRYSDLMMFMQFGGSIQVSASVVRYLETEWPSQDGYTIAEVITAQMTLGVVRAHNDLSDGKSGAELVAAEELYGAYDFYSGTQSVQLSSLEAFRSVLIEYRDLLNGKLVTSTVETLDNNFLYQQATEDNDGLWPSLGWSQDLDLTMSFPREAASQTYLARYLRERFAFTEYLGCSVSEVEEHRVSYEDYTSTWIGWSPSSASFTTVDGEFQESVIALIPEVDVSEEDDVQDEESSIESKPASDIFSEQAQHSQSVVNVEPAYEVEAVDTSRHFGLEDVMVTGCLIIVVFAVGAWAVIDTIRKRKDPMKKYKRWR